MSLWESVWVRDAAVVWKLDWKRTSQFAEVLACSDSVGVWESSQPCQGRQV